MNFSPNQSKVNFKAGICRTTSMNIVECADYPKLRSAKGKKGLETALLHWLAAPLANPEPENDTQLVKPLVESLAVCPTSPEAMQ